MIAVEMPAAQSASNRGSATFIGEDFNKIHPLHGSSLER
jgi:hypothetical protein